MYAREYKLHPIGNAQLVKNSEQIVLHGVLGQGQLLANLAIGKPFDREANHRCLAPCDTGFHCRVELEWLWRFSKSAKNVVQFFRIYPNLTSGNNFYRLAQ